MTVLYASYFATDATTCSSGSGTTTCPEASRERIPSRVSIHLAPIHYVLCRKFPFGDLFVCIVTSTSFMIIVPQTLVALLCLPPIVIHSTSDVLPSCTESSAGARQ